MDTPRNYILKIRSMAKISVIIPVYKCENDLPRCIDSVMAQTFTEWECLLVDDGSPDRSGAVCDDYAQKDTRIKVIHKENGGASSARNAGLEYATGERITFVDADDEIMPDFLETAMRYDEDVVSFAMERLEYRTLNKVDVVDNIPCPVVIINRERIVDAVYKTKNRRFNSPCATVWKKDIIANNRYNLKLKICEDSLFIMQCVCNAKSIRTLNQVAYRYYLPQNTSKKYQMTVSEAVVHMSEYEQTANKYPIPHKWLSERYEVFLGACIHETILSPSLFYGNKKMMEFYHRYKDGLMPNTQRMYNLYRFFNWILKPLYKRRYLK